MFYFLLHFSGLARGETYRKHMSLMESEEGRKWLQPRLPHVGLTFINFRGKSSETLWKGDLAASFRLDPEHVAVGDRRVQCRSMGRSHAAFLVPGSLARVLLEASLPDISSLPRETSRLSSFYKASALYNMALLKDVEGDESTARSLLLEAIQAGGVGGGLGVKLDVFPMAAACHTRLGLIHARDKDYTAALKMFKRAYELDPDDITARRNMIVVLDAFGSKQESKALIAVIYQDEYQNMVNEDPNFASIALDQVQVMLQAGDPVRMEDKLSDYSLPTCRILDGQRSLQAGIEDDPTDVNAWYQLGTFFRTHDMVWDCVRALSNALRILPTHAPSLAVMGGTLSGPVCSSKPRPLPRLDLPVFTLLSQWDKNRFHMKHSFVKEFVEQLQGGIDTDLKSFPAPAHMLFIIGTPPTDLPLATYRRWVDLWAEEQAARIDFTMFFPSYPRYEGGKLRVGWASGAGFQKSPGSSAIRGVFALHDRRTFEVHCFALKPDLRANDLRGNVSGSCDFFYEMGNIANDKDLATLVNSHRPHVLIDVSGFSGDHRIKFLAHRPAPLSFTFCEYPGTLDRIASPPEFEALPLPLSFKHSIYSEKLLLVPPPYLPNDYRATVRVPTHAMGRLPEDEIVFCALHHVWKMDEDIFSVWMELLLHVPGSKLRLQECAEEAKVTMRQFASRKGVDPSRLVFNPKIGDYYEHVDKLSKCRLFLDAPKYNAHTSAGDALWANVPVITVPHQMMVHRGAACLVYSTNVTSTIVRNLEDYKVMALRLGSDIGALEQVREQMQRYRYTSNMFDTARWTAELDRSIKAAWEAKWHRVGSQAPSDKEPASQRASFPCDLTVLVTSSSASPQISLLSLLALSSPSEPSPRKDKLECKRGAATRALQSLRAAAWRLPLQHTTKDLKKCALVTIEGNQAFANFGGGGQGDVPTVRGVAIIPDGAADLEILITGDARRTLPLGDNHSEEVPGDTDPYRRAASAGLVHGQQWRHVQWEQGYRRIKFRINGKEVGGVIEQVTGEVQLAVQLFSKGDKVMLEDQVIPDDDEQALENEEERYQEMKKQEELIEEERKRRWDEEEKKRLQLEEEANKRKLQEEREKMKIEREKMQKKFEEERAAVTVEFEQTTPEDLVLTEVDDVADNVLFISNTRNPRKPYKLDEGNGTSRKFTRGE
ncbi:hypothetical protein GUITHDRAFT_163991 [Guillardia theta CCMP2712]|uniref:protein O-GlcNAc transferase n=1 Tax=Guillardia theta (strain CCMP2712) TaxID=905079 RepID=L1J3U0_GUITC|nr:hypothetical protein GUITHDRAFT_163991 [Guillardia theta CCMP2712]EKX42992.1 hypothetical protein GUITHDRAFT_163991 [Guillardia theta CCMP2712]|eukprot:XP_005829972.1 hypothetical protein GUITHDRAFT_163991 [Guillardia theta CCMP2712]